jgi:hypothetical protein
LTEKIAAALAMEELLAIRPPIVFGHRARLPEEGPPMTSNETRRKPMKSTPRCDICNGKFGLIRHRFAQKQFCSKRCLNQYLVERKQQPSSVTQWKALAGLKAFRWLRDQSRSRLNGLRIKGMLSDPGKRPGTALR